jgi:hypothetical protein
MGLPHQTIVMKKKHIKKPAGSEKTYQSHGMNNKEKHRRA